MFCDPSWKTFYCIIFTAVLLTISKKFLETISGSMETTWVFTGRFLDKENNAINTGR